MPTPLEPRPIALPGRWNDPDFHLSAYDLGEGPAVVFVHGFPDLALGWKHQLEAVSRAGYRVLAPDMRGYGGSSRPHEVEAYTLAELTGDLVALLDALDIEQAVFVGHDWGGFVAWAMPVLHPGRVAGIAAACTPYMPFPDTATHLAIVDGEVERQYVAWFQEPGVAEAYMDTRARDIVAKIMRTSVPLDEVFAVALADGKLNMNPFRDIESTAELGEPLLSEEDFEYYVAAFTRSGFRGGVNWYRNIDQNARAHPDVGVAPLDIPCLMLMADLDPALRPEFAADMPQRCSNLEMHLVEGAGHWVQHEQAQVVNDHLLAWLGRWYPAG
ncbi:MAG: alpha/beta hydrolase [Halioglobus sp.]|nr:alpha/beta hydrolase [Halioglobus sp.]